MGRGNEVGGMGELTGKEVIGPSDRLGTPGDVGRLYRTYYYRVIF